MKDKNKDKVIMLPPPPQSMVSWLPDEQERVFIAMVLRATRRGQSLGHAEKLLNDVLSVLEKTGYAVVPRGLLDAVHNYGRRKSHVIK